MNVHSYQVGMINAEDPIAKEDTLPRTLIDALAKTLTKVEELLSRGDGRINEADFMHARGDVLDLLDRSDIVSWLEDMRRANRCPFRRFSVRN
jgi:hypothetical protein